MTVSRPTQSRCHHGYPQSIFHRLIDHRTNDDGCIFGREPFDGIHDLMHFLHFEAGTGSDIHENTSRAGEIDIFQQRTGYRLFGR